MKPINVLSLFDGISCGMQALIRAGIPVKNYYAAEVDKYANAVSVYNYPNIKRLGDVKKVNINKLPKIDLVLSGSPCQGFSISGKRLGFEDPRSKLFFDFVKILDNIKRWNPKVKFLFENVTRMKPEWIKIINDCLGVEPIKVNSSLLSAQNRSRYYWTNIYGILQPVELGLILDDIIIDDAQTDKYKSNAIIANYSKTSLKNYFKNQGQMVIAGDAEGINGHKQKRKVYHTYGKAPTQTADAHRMGGNECKICIEIGRADIKGFDVRKRVYSTKGKCPALTSNSGGGHEKKIAVPRTKTGIQGPNKKQILKGYVWRKLFPIECERLQTIPDNYTLVPHPVYKNRMMSNSQRYKMIGNAWTVDVIAHILKCYENIDEKFKQQSLPGF